MKIGRFQISSDRFTVVDDEGDELGAFIADSGGALRFDPNDTCSYSASFLRELADALDKAEKKLK